MTSTARPATDSANPGVLAPRTASDSPADRFMRRLLRIRLTDATAVEGAHRAFRVSIIVSGIRCLVSYLLIPILVPIVSFAGVVAVPVSIGLCVLAGANGILSLRRFWAADHRARWMYTGFVGFIFLVLVVALTLDIARLVSAA